MPKIGASLSLLIAMIVLRALHADHVLGGAGDADGDVDVGLDDLAGLADLVAVGHPAGVDDGPRGARRTLQQLGQRLDHLVLAGLAEATTTGDDDRRPRRASGRCAPRRGRPSTLAPPVAPSSATGAAATSAAPPPADSATKLFGRNAARNGPSPVNVVVTSVLPPNTGVVTVTVAPSTAMSTLFVSTVLSSLTDRRAMHVAALVGLREHDQVGRVAAVDDGLHRRWPRRRRAGARRDRRWRRPWWRRTRRARRPRPRRRRRGTPRRRRAQRALVSSSSVPEVGAPSLACAKTQIFSPQITFRFSRNDTILAKPSPSSSMISPAWRSAAWPISTISWPAPAQPTG